MKVERVIVGPLQSNCYIVYDEKTLDALIIDPGDEPEKIIGVLETKKLKVGYIVCTHGHFDHVGGVSRIKDRTGAKVVIHKNDLEIYSRAKDQALSWQFNMESPSNPDMFVIDDDELSFGGLKLKVMLTPGHSPGGICLYGEGIVLTGDTVFAGSVGRTDFFGGNLEELKKSFSKIISLPSRTQILPGHGECSTVEDEKEYNFFMHEL
jgi:hydroxyacylglutathione hydrolase